MDLYAKMLNISGNNVLLSIQEAIKETTAALKYLTYERMCLVYSSYLYNNLSKRHLLVRLIDTNDINLKYQHRFILVKDNNIYYLCDLTFAQFNSSLFLDLNTQGYMLCDNQLFNEYLKVVTNEYPNIFLEDVFISNNINQHFR